jgi:tetratricopeptide (TPR) repeat protein
MPVFSTFNPSMMSREVLEATFVQRHSIAERLVAVFEESATRDSKHNILLVGPRGIGKSHLVSLVKRRLTSKKGIADKLCIAYLREDEWGVNSFLDLLLRIYRVISDLRGADADEKASDLTVTGSTAAENVIWRRLRATLGTRTLLLIVENLGSIFEKIGEEGQRQWRALMQTYPCWSILASTPALFSGISNQVSPFYGFFEIIPLQPLTLNNALELLQKLAHINKDAETASFLESPAGRARVRAVQHIAGGNHRLFVLFYGFLRENGTSSFVASLLRTIDALTPYYQSQMEKLSPQQQKIVNFLCEHQKPATVKAIAAHCFITHQTAAGQLKQLLESRYLRVDRLGRESFYELSEPLLRICVEAKSHSEAPLDLLVDFMRYWFSREELERRLSNSADNGADRVYFKAALKEYDSHNGHVHLAPEIAPLCAALSREKDKPEILRRYAEELAELSKIAEDWPHYTRALAWLGRSAEAIPFLEKKLQEKPQDAKLLQALARAHGFAGDRERALHLFDRALEVQPNSAALFMDKGQVLYALDRFSEALAAFDQAEFIDRDYAQNTEKAKTLIAMETYSGARKALSPLLRNGRRIPDVFRLFGIAWLNEGNPEQALKYFDKATVAFENDPVAWSNKGTALCELGKYPEALPALNRSLELDPHMKRARYCLCQALIETRQYAKAVEVATPEDLAHNIFHQLLKIANSKPKQGKVQQELLQLQDLNESEAWRTAFIGALTEFAGSAAQLQEEGDIKQLPIWNAALRELFADELRFSLIVPLFDVVTRWKVFKDEKALLELPLEQRQLLIGER